jgi:hypothetical protein
VVKATEPFSNVFNKVLELARQAYLVVRQGGKVCKGRRIWTVPRKRMCRNGGLTVSCVYQDDQSAQAEFSFRLFPRPGGPVIAVGLTSESHLQSLGNKVGRSVLRRLS